MKPPPTAREALPVLPSGYRLIRKLGAGNMGEVYLVEDLSRRALVALKLLGTSGTRDSEASARFRREALAQSQVESPHVVAIYAFDFDSDPAYLAMEFVEGISLEEHLSRQPEHRLPLEQVLGIASCLGKGLETLHQMGVLHRDLKPSNLMIREGTGEAVILDLGLAQVSDATALTATGQMIGTPLYMPPELIRGSHDSSVRGEVYQLGAILYECLAGRRMIQAESLDDLYEAILEGDPPELPLEVVVPEEIRTSLQRAVARDPEQRFGSIREFVQALRPLPRKAPKPRPVASQMHPRRSLRWIVAGALLLLATLWWTLSRPQVPSDLRWEIEGDALAVSFLPGGSEELRLEIDGKAAKPSRLEEQARSVLVVRDLPAEVNFTAQLFWSGGSSPRVQLRREPPILSERIRLRAPRHLEVDLRRNAWISWKGSSDPEVAYPTGQAKIPLPAPDAPLPPLRLRAHRVEVWRNWSWQDLHLQALDRIQETPSDEDLVPFLEAWERDPRASPLEAVRREWQELLPWLPEIFLGPLPLPQKFELWNRWQSYQRFEALEVASGHQPLLLELPPHSPGGRPNTVPSEPEYASLGDVDGINDNEVNLVTPERRGGGTLGNLVGLIRFAFPWPEIPGDSPVLTLGLHMRRWHPTTMVRLRPRSETGGAELVLRSIPPPEVRESSSRWILLRFPRALAPAPGTAMVFEMLPQDQPDLRAIFLRDLRIFWPRD